MQFREDIEGLRGVAVVVVVLFHVGFAGVAGGYVGVDVFFVISGFLISSQLIGRLEDHGRIGFVDFWARRFRRLMPLLVVTIVGTLAVGMVVYSPLFWKQLSREGISSVLYLSNIHFARDSSFYFQSASSPLLHTWSLSVEEQFYVAWPLIFAVVGLVAIRFRRTLTTCLLSAVLVTSVLSFVIAVLLVRRGSPWAFFSSPSRASEFGFGALTLLASRRWQPARTAVQAAFGWLGLGAIVVASMTFDQFTDMPGTAALLPVVGTGLVLLMGSGERPTGVALLLVARPLRSLGRVSYAWYLFHWPAIVLTAAAIQRSSRFATSIAAIGSLGLAYLATSGIERPIRRSRRLARPTVMLGAAGLAAALTVASALVIDGIAERKLRDPYLASLLAIRDGRTETGSQNCLNETLRDGTSICVYGDPDSDTTVLLLGDSHAAQWAPAVEEAARRLSFRLIVRTRGGCPSYAVYVARTGDDEASEACISFRSESARLLQQIGPDLVVLTNADFTSRLLSSPRGRFLDRGEAIEAWGIAAAMLAEQITAAGADIAVIEDNPTQEREPIECLARHRSVTLCSVLAERAVPPVAEISAVEQSALSSVLPISVFRTAPLICDTHRCWVERDGVTVYADRNHVSREFVLRQADAIASFIGTALSANRS